MDKGEAECAFLDKGELKRSCQQRSVQGSLLQYLEVACGEKPQKALPGPG